MFLLLNKNIEPHNLVYKIIHMDFHSLVFQVWQMAENIYNDEEPETPASELESGAS